MQIRFRIISILIILIVFSGCGVDKKIKQLVEKNKVIIECDVESWKEDKLLDKTGNFELSNAKGRTDEQHRSGKYSLKLVKESPYGMTIEFNNIRADEFFWVTVWQKGNGHICASDDMPEGFYLSTGEPIETDSLGWQKLSLEFYIPHDYETSKLKLLLANFGEAPVYFDDLKIEREREKVFPAYSSQDVMNIFISEENFQKLSIKRSNAISEGLLVTEKDDWVNAIIFYKHQVLNAKLRLKGDRLDHLQGIKWSYRIRIKGEDSWNGMKTFSIQTPAARNYLHEWFFHKALEKEDILCTRYGFVPVSVNGQSLGIYAWEEHFEKHLIEGRNRREGPILKLSDDSYWLNDKIRRQRETDFSIPNYDASIIQPFDEKGCLEDSLLMNEFKYGRDLYQQYKYARALPSDIFDLEAIAKYYAMTDATNAYHTLHFFNQRFYYNPVLGKLEPIFYDSFADVGIFDFDGYNLIPENAENVWLSIHLKMFADPEFRKLYWSYLEKYSSKKFWEKLYLGNENDISQLNKAIKREFKDYNFDINVFYNIAQQANNTMQAIKDDLEANNVFNKFADRTQGLNRNYFGKADFEILPHLVKVFTQDERRFYIQNFSTDTIIITGFSDISQFEAEKLDNEVILPPANLTSDFSIELNSKNKNHKFIFVKIRNKKISIPIIPWNFPEQELPYIGVQHSFNRTLLEEIGIKDFDGDTLYFEGNITIDKHLVIPRKKYVVINKNTKIDVINGATFISYSPVFIRGTASEPVIIGSSDHTGKGFNVFQAKERSNVEHTVFTGLTKLNFGGWITTTSVCFYESDVDLFNVRFENNVDCDDALNIVRSDFLIENCTFENTFADAFDSDFCTGEIIESHFIKPGNDAVDFSGSVVKLNKCIVSGAGDKGISCGEASTISIYNCKINGCNIGIASKDKSKTEIFDSEIENVTYGLVALRKKPEYGPATIKAERLTISKYLFLHLIEEGSIVNFNNREVFGQEKNLADRFY